MVKKKTKKEVTTIMVYIAITEDGNYAFTEYKPALACYSDMNQNGIGWEDDTVGGDVLCVELLDILKINRKEYGVYCLKINKSFLKNTICKTCGVGHVIVK